jgi:uncharacterized protein with NRDE domain
MTPSYFLMCLILLAIRKHPKYKLVLLANRDEYYERPSEVSQFWEEVPHLLAGRDLIAGGTWLGITRNGRIAAITNYRDPSSVKAKAPSRGNLVSLFLSRAMEPNAYVDLIRNERDRYNGFNLILGKTDLLYWYSNRTDRIVPLFQGVYGLSNHLLNTPWPKVARAKRLFEEILHGRTSPSTEALFHLLQDQKRPPDDRLPRTGVPLEWERILSPIFITSPTYGTRSSTIILIDNEDYVTFVERTFNGRPKPVSTCEFEFVLESTDSGAEGHRHKGIEG